MDNHKILNALREIGMPVKLMAASLLCFVVSAIDVNYLGFGWGVFLALMVLSIGVFVGSAGTVLCRFIAKRRGKQNRPFLNYLVTNLLLILALVILSIADGGLLGALILYYAVPILVGLNAAVGIICLLVKYRHRMRLSVKILIVSFFASLVTVIAFFMTAFSVFGVMALLATGAFAGSAGTVISGITARRKGKQEKPLLGFLLGDLLLILALVAEAVCVLLPEGGNEKLGHLILYAAVPLLVGFDAVVAAALHRRKVMQQEESDI